MGQFASQAEANSLDLAKLNKISRASNLVSRNTQWLLYVAALIFSDILMTLVGFWLSYVFRYITFEKYFTGPPLCILRHTNFFYTQCPFFG